MKLLEAFKEGQSTVDVRKTKVRAIATLVATPSALGLYAVIKAFWPETPLDVEDVASICAVLASLVGVVSHIISTKRLGVRRGVTNQLEQ